MEKDDEINGSGNSYTTDFRQYDPMLGRWFSTDPVALDEETPYSFVSDNPINYVDPMGLTKSRNSKFELAPKKKTGKLFKKAKRLVGKIARGFSSAFKTIKIADSELSSNIEGNLKSLRVLDHWILANNGENAKELVSFLPPVAAANIYYKVSENNDSFGGEYGNLNTAIDAASLIPLGKAGAITIKVVAAGAVYGYIVRIVNHGHHLIPKFLKGLDVASNLKNIPANVHRDLHSRLNAALRAAGFPPDRGVKGGKDIYDRFFLDNPDSQEKAYQILEEVTKEIDKLHNTNIYDALKKSLDLGNYR